MLRIGILGTGAMGSLFAAKLAPHADVTVLGTWEQGVQAMNRHGVLLEDEAGRNTVRVPATTDPSEVLAMDLALIAVKAHQTERAAQWASQILAPDGIAITLQNGLGNLQVLAEAVGTARSTLGVTMQGATLMGPGHVRHGGKGLTTLSSLPDNRAAVEAVAELYRRAGFETRVTDDVTSLMWGKLVVNSAINALTAIYRVPNGWLVEHNEARALMSAAAQETADVAAALGIALPYADPVARALQVATETASNHSSTLQDIARGAPTELERINGAVIREGKRVGVPTPINEKLMRVLSNPRLKRRQLRPMPAFALSG